MDVEVTEQQVEVFLLQCFIDSRGNRHHEACSGPLTWLANPMDENRVHAERVPYVNDLPAVLGDRSI